MSLAVSDALTFFTGWKDHQDPTQAPYIYVAAVRRWDRNQGNDDESRATTYTLSEEESRRVLNLDALDEILKDREPMEWAVARTDPEPLEF